MRHTLGSLILGLAAGCFPAVLTADVTVNSSLSLTQLEITSSIGTAEISGVTASAFASVFDSLGGADQQFDPGPSMASVNVATALAKGAGAADAGALTAIASSGVHIPGGLAAEAGTNAVGPYGDLSGSFEIVDSTPGQNPVTVNFSAALKNDQELSTDADGVSATSETIFNLLVDGNTELFLDDPLQIGPSTSLANVFSPTLTGSDDTLLTNTVYSFDAQVDAESYGLNVPEPSSIVLLASISLLLVRRFRRA